MAHSSSHTGALDINEVFRGGGRSIEFLDRINQASIVMLAETGLIPRATASSIAKGIAQVIAQTREGEPRRSADYLDYEPRLTAIVGPTLRACIRDEAARTSPRRLRA